MAGVFWCLRVSGAFGILVFQVLVFWVRELGMCGCSGGGGVLSVWVFGMLRCLFDVFMFCERVQCLGACSQRLAVSCALVF